MEVSRRRSARRTAARCGQQPQHRRPQHPIAAPTALTVILLDGLNTNFADRHNSEQALMQFLGDVSRVIRSRFYLLSDTLQMMKASGKDGVARATSTSS